MSKKNKKTTSSPEATTTSPHAAYNAEYRIIKHDLIRLLVLNAMYLAGVLGVYFSNQKTHYMEKAISKLLNF